MDEPDHYQVLGVLPDASKAQINLAFNQKSFEIFPNSSKEPSTETAAQVQQLSDSWKILNNESSRRVYDKMREKKAGFAHFWANGQIESVYKLNEKDGGPVGVQRKRGTAEAIPPDTETLNTASKGIMKLEELYGDAKEFYYETHNLSFGIGVNGALAKIPADMIRMIRHMTLSVHDIKGINDIAKEVRHATNVRNLTLTANVPLANDRSLHIAAIYILPFFEHLKTLTVEFRFRDKHSQNRDEATARSECRSFVPTIDTMLGMRGMWMMKRMGTDVWTWEAEGRYFEMAETDTSGGFDY